MLFALNWHTRNTTSLTPEEMVLRHRNIGAVTSSAMYLHNTLASPHKAILSTLRKSSFLTGAQESHLQTVKIPEAAYIQLLRRPPEDEQGNAQNM